MVNLPGVSNYTERYILYKTGLIFKLKVQFTNNTGKSAMKIC
jgi:hypothetical protein